MKLGFAPAWNQLPWEAKGLCLLLLRQAKGPEDIPEDKEALNKAIRGSGKWWSVLFPWITDLKLMADQQRSVKRKRKEAAEHRWKDKPEVAPGKIRRIKITPLKGKSVECFERLWEAWPKRGDGKPSRGEKGKAMKLFQEIVDSKAANPFELEEATVVYRSYPKVRDGYVKMVTTFFAIKDGMWMECLERVRKGPRAQELARMA